MAPLVAGFCNKIGPFLKLPYFERFRSWVITGRVENTYKTGPHDPFRK